MKKTTVSLVLFMLAVFGLMFSSGCTMPKEFWMSPQEQRAHREAERHAQVIKEREAARQVLEEELARKRKKIHENPCGYISEAIDTLKECATYSHRIDTIKCIDHTVEAWIEFTAGEQYSATKGRVFRYDPTAGMWHYCLLKFFDTAKTTFRFFHSANRYRVVVFMLEIRRDKYGNISSRRKIPIAKFQIDRETSGKINWKYAQGLFLDTRIEAAKYGYASGTSRLKLLAMLDAYWVDKKYLK